MAWRDYTAQPKANFSADFVINKNLNLPSNYIKKGLVAAEMDNLLSTVNGTSDNDNFTVNVPTAAGGTGEDITIRFVSSDPSDGTANEIQIKIATLGGVAADAVFLIVVINGNPGADYGAGSGDATNGIAGITAAVGGLGLPNVKITATQAGEAGNDIIFTETQDQGTMITDGAGEAAVLGVGELLGGEGVDSFPENALPFFLNTPGPATLRNRSTPYKVTK